MLLAWWILAAAPVFASQLSAPATASSTAPANDAACAQANARAPVSSPTPTGTTAKAAAPAAASAKPAAKPAAAPIVPLQANGLIERSLRQLGQWFDGLGSQLDQARQALWGLLQLLARSGGHIANDADRRLLIQAGTALAGVFAAGLVSEWLLHWLLKRPLRALVARANAVEARDRMHETQDRAAVHVDAQAPAAERGADTQAKATAGVQPAADDVALVQTHEDGIDRVEPVRVGAQNTAGGPQDKPRDTLVAAASVATLKDKMHKAAHYARPARYVNTLHHLLFATGALLLNLLPLIVFFVVAGLVLRELGGNVERVHAVVSAFIDAYITTRVTIAVLRLLVSPEGPGLCVLRVSRRTTGILLAWIRCIVVLAAFGIAIGDTILALGGGAASRMAFIKLVSLGVHIAAVILILRVRRPVAQAIAAPPASTGPVAAARNWLARVWALFAIVFVMGVWVVWALGVEDGFPKLIHFIGVSAGILIAARLLAILAQGALGRLFRRSEGDAAAAVPAGSARNRLTRRYYPVASRLVSFFIIVFTVVALLQAWGLDAVGWFVHGAIGRNLTSAALTILVATVIAIAVWEAASISIERRIDEWTGHGDLMRAARLRTLLPMLRTSLLVAVVLVVGLTALNEIGINTTPLLASASIVGVALGFGSQKLVQDFITGIFLLMENAMQVGDWVTVAGVSGTVEYLSVRTVRLRGGDGSLYTVPFSSVTTVNNTNRGLGNAAMSVNIAHVEDVDRAMEELKKIGSEMRSDPAFQGSILKDIQVWGVDAMDGSKVTIDGQIPCTDSGRWGVQRELNRRILLRFRELGIEIANPRTQTLLTPNDSTPTAKNPAEN
ncbi:mechanosensitive ion channel [Dyella jejuensis]|uniref:Mechanosensitive ion channel n=1 Tax=Dyella jejuensis TaxID=1432009 RepID=A0ABW8JHS7_9GAMM